MLDEPLLTEGSRALLEGLVNGTLHSLGVACVLMVLSRLGVPARPAFRHLVWLSGLVLIVALYLRAATDSLSRAAWVSVRREGGVQPAISSTAVPSGSLDATHPEPARLFLEMPGTGWLPALLAVIVLVGVVRLALVARGIHYWRAIRARSEPLSGDAAWVKALARDGSGRTPEVRLSREVVCPVTMGYRRPTVLLPPALTVELSPLELRQILAHEIAHVRRRDDWANLVQRLAEAVFFFNPVVAWLGRRMEMERELACDQHVLADVGDPKSYASCLLRLASVGRFPASGLVTGAAACRLTERVEAMLRPSDVPGAPRIPLVFACGAVASITLLLVVAGRGSIAFSVALGDRNSWGGEAAAAEPAGLEAWEWTGVATIALSGAGAGADPEAATIAAPAEAANRLPEGPGGSESAQSTIPDTPIEIPNQPSGSIGALVSAASACAPAGARYCAPALEIPDQMRRTLAPRGGVANPPADAASARPTRRRGLTVLASGSGRMPLIGTPGDTYDEPQPTGTVVTGTIIGTTSEGPVVADSGPASGPSPAIARWLP